MSFAREGYPYLLTAAGLATATFAAALGRRSFTLWLLAFALTIATLSIAYAFREPKAPDTPTRPFLSDVRVGVHA